MKRKGQRHINDQFENLLKVRIQDWLYELAVDCALRGVMWEKQAWANGLKHLHDECALFKPPTIEPEAYNNMFKLILKNNLSQVDEQAVIRAALKMIDATREQQ